VQVNGDFTLAGKGGAIEAKKGLISLRVRAIFPLFIVCRKRITGLKEGAKGPNRPIPVTQFFYKMPSGFGQYSLSIFFYESFSKLFITMIFV